MKKGKKGKKNEEKKVAKLTNTKYAESDVFIKACDVTRDAGYKVNPTVRQASKYRNKKGIVYLFTSGQVGGAG